jgi:hypothetical protein
VAGGCTNNPYPDADRDQKVLYSSFHEAPKTLDPAVAYSTAEHVVTGNVFDTLLEYHSSSVPTGDLGLAGRCRSCSQGPTAPGLSLRIARRALPRRSCFALDGTTTREVTAADYFALANADPAVTVRHLELRTGGALRGPASGSSS